MCLERLMHFSVRSIVLYIWEIKTLLTFLTFAMFWMLYAFFRVIPRRRGITQKKAYNTLLTLWYVLLFLKIGCCHMHIIMPSSGGMGRSLIYSVTRYSCFILRTYSCVFDWTTFQLVLQHNGMAPIKELSRIIHKFPGTCLTCNLLSVLKQYKKTGSPSHHSHDAKEKSLFLPGK
jgi:hypothetical protein